MFYSGRGYRKSTCCGFESPKHFCHGTTYYGRILLQLRTMSSGEISNLVYRINKPRRFAANISTVNLSFNEGLMCNDFFLLRVTTKTVQYDF